jgi:hypothetical protein
MTYAARSSTAVPWRREPTRDQWYAFIAAWLGWTLDAFDFTVFLLLWGRITSFMLPKQFVSPPLGARSATGALICAAGDRSRPDRNHLQRRSVRTRSLLTIIRSLRRNR